MTFLTNKLTEDSALAIEWRKQQILSWALSSAFHLSSVTLDANQAIQTASIKWPDGATGTFTTDVASTAFPGAIDAWHATYQYGNTLMYTVTQPQITRSAAPMGAIAEQPDIIIA